MTVVQRHDPMPRDPAGRDPVAEELALEHRRDWDAFVRFSSYGIAGVAVLLILMAIFLL